jgi:hypothetical protein
MKKIIENVLTILGGSVLIMGFILGAESFENFKQEKHVAAATISHMQETTAYQDDFVFEVFKIENVNDKGEIRGEIIGSSAWSTGEGIYLDDTYTKSDISSLKVGDIILVVYDKQDYEEEIWDNILDVKKLNK